MRARTSMLAAAVALAACSAGTGAPRPVRRWVDTRYTPAVRELHDPRLAPYRLSPVPTAAELRDGCAEALRRHDAWSGPLRDVPDRDLHTLVGAWLDAERAQLAECARTGRWEVADHLKPVLDRLTAAGIDFPEG